uniref:Uncharacterized protein n=1 Tax=viral metagenome TaxID=1070528 RepID=A0A6M3JUW2_9ZZZZ
MSGVKGLSGRKSLKDEEKRLRIIERSWDVIEEFLNNPDIKLKDKADLASRLTVKDLPTQLEGALSFLQMPTATVNGQPLEIKVGDTNTT